MSRTAMATWLRRPIMPVSRGPAAYPSLRARQESEPAQDRAHLAALAPQIITQRRAVLDHYLLPEHLRHRPGDQPRHRVGRAAGLERRHDGDEAVGKVLGMGALADEE